MPFEDQSFFEERSGQLQFIPCRNSIFLGCGDKRWPLRSISWSWSSCAENWPLQLGSNFRTTERCLFSIPGDFSAHDRQVMEMLLKIHSQQLSLYTELPFMESPNGFCMIFWHFPSAQWIFPGLHGGEGSTEISPLYGAHDPPCAGGPDVYGMAWGRSWTFLMENPWFFSDGKWQINEDLGYPRILMDI